MATNRRAQKPKSKVNSKEVMIHSSNKLGRHLDIVKSGSGIHKTYKDKCRVKKWDVNYQEN